MMGAYQYGRAFERLLCLGTYIRSFEHYSTLLSTLAKQGRLDELSRVVVCFDNEWKVDAQSRSRLETLVANLEQASSSRKDETPLKEEDAPNAESPERMILNVSLSMHSVDYFNRLALEYPFFDQRMTVKLLDAPMADLNDIIAEQAGISVHAIDGAGSKSISITAAEQPLRTILLELAATHGFLYESAQSPDGDVIMLFMYNVEPMLRGVEDSQSAELKGNQGDRAP